MTTSFLASLSGGMLLTLATGEVERIAWRFLRLIGFIAFALYCVVTAWSARTSAGLGGVFTERAGLCVVGAVGAVGLVMLAPFAQRFPIVLRTICAFAGFAGLGAVWTAGETDAPDPHGLSLGVLGLLLIGELLRALFLGSITLTWLLGHAYLTATKMTLTPLRHFSRVVTIVVVARLLYLPLGLAGAYLLGVASGAELIEHLWAAWLIVLLRVGVGLAAVSVFAFMVVDCVRLRATQSATGILYFSSVFAYVGELASRHLTDQWGWPF